MIAVGKEGVDRYGLGEVRWWVFYANAMHISIQWNILWVAQSEMVSCWAITYVRAYEATNDVADLPSVASYRRYIAVTFTVGRMHSAMV